MDYDPNQMAWLETWREYRVALPYMVVWLVGLILAFVLMRRHPGASGLIVIGFVLLFIEVLGGTYIFYLTLFRLDNAFEGRERMAWLVPLILYIRSGIKALAWILFLVAMFAWRSRNAYQWYD
jgi:hypothetical protein